MPSKPMNSELLNVDDIVIWGLDLSVVGTVALVFIMVSMGFTLTTGDFRRVFVQPKAIIVGLTAQLILLPMAAFALVYALQPPLPVAIGIIILSCCPSGATSNFFSYLAAGNVAISVSLTALSGTIVLFTIPLLVNLGIHLFSTDSDATVYLPVIESMLRIFAMIVVPVGTGMLIRAWKPTFTMAIERYTTVASFATIVFTMAAILVHIQPILPEMLEMAGLITVVLNVTMMTLGFLLAKIYSLSEKDTRSVCIEVGVQNYLLSVVIAIGLLKTPSYAIVPIVYLFVMYCSVFSFIAYCRFFRAAKMPSDSDIQFGAQL